MKIQFLGTKGLLITAALVLAPPLAKADQIDDQKEHIQLLTDLANSARSNLGDFVNAFYGAGVLVSLGDKATMFQGALDAKKMLTSEATGPGDFDGTQDTKNMLVNNPNEPEDFISRLAGSTQSEESVAWCGNNAIVGFNDSGSFVRTMFPPSPSPSRSLSGNGWSVSTNVGQTFTDKGILLPDPLPPGTRFLDLFGDPVVGCTDEVTFYFSSLATRITIVPPSGSFSGISVSKSTNGGQSFGGAKMAVEKDARFHVLDKPWMDVKRGSSGNDTIYNTYTDFDFSGFANPVPPCGRTVRTAIEFIRSTDGGATWSSPTVIDEVCGFVPFVQGSHVAVGLGSDVFVAWESYPNAFRPGRQIKLRKSANAGTSFGPALTVTDVTAVGTGLYVQGFFRDSLDFQGLAVDRSISKDTGGNVYITWQDGRNLSQPDPFGVFGGGCPTFPSYCFGDILFTRSTNGGATWSAPVRVNDDPISLKVDQMFPAVGVDKDGRVFVVFYDRRRDARNFLIDAFVANSQDAGQSWENRRLTSNNFSAIHDEDLVVNPVYMGDYLGIANDVTGRYNGVIVSWGDNSLGDPNVAKAKVQSGQGDNQQGGNQQLNN